LHQAAEAEQMPELVHRDGHEIGQTARVAFGTEEEARVRVENDALRRQIEWACEVIEEYQWVTDLGQLRQTDAHARVRYRR
jgi:hypothetical protein